MDNNCFRSHCVLLISLTTLVGVEGCGPQHPAATYPVRGKVVFADGSPLTTGGTVLSESMAAEGRRFNARGAIQSDGTFLLSTFEEQDGAVAGKHRALVRAKRDGTDYVEKGILPEPVIDRRFEKYKTSGLQFTVDEDEEDNELTIVVERPRLN